MNKKNWGTIMEFRKAGEKDISSIMRIILQAQAYFKEQGINQWQNNYPNIETIKSDIAQRNSYVFITNNSVVATAVISFDGEKTYSKIYEGKWITNQEYGVVHRMAVDNNFKGMGLSSIIFQKAEELCIQKGVYNLRIDTHENNKAMKQVIAKNKLIYCGIIYLEDGSKRIAFEKVLNI